MSSDFELEELTRIAQANERTRAVLSFNYDATRCVDELTTRFFVNEERDKTIDALEAMLNEIEKGQDDVEQRIARTQEECGIVRRLDDLRGVSHAATDPQLSALWKAKCDDFYAVLQEHKVRYAMLLGRQMEAEKEVVKSGAVFERLFKTPSKQQPV